MYAVACNEWRAAKEVRVLWSSPCCCPRSSTLRIMERNEDAACGGAEAKSSRAPLADATYNLIDENS